MTDVATISCVRCEQTDVRLDENGWCEQCWLDLWPAYQLFQDLEELVGQTLDTGLLSPAQLEEALRMSLADSNGTLTGAGFRRRPVKTQERGIWHLPPSAFDTDECDTRRNQIVHSRHCARLSIEELAARIGVPVQTLALWENDVLPLVDDWPAVERMAELFSVSTAGLLGHDRLVEGGG